MSPDGGRTCSRTGLRLLPAEEGYGYHVGKTSYPAISAPERSVGQSRRGWNRYDTIGSTFYVAQTRACAFAEVLASYKRLNGRHDSLAVDAAFQGMSLEQYVEEVSREWAERDFMGLGALPASWRFTRAVYPIALPEQGWWVEVEHPDSVSVLERIAEAFLADHAVDALDTSVLRSGNRVVTTGLAEILRGARLDDGSSPLGVHFGSKHGGGWCKAIWLRVSSVNDLQALSGEPILLTDPDLTMTADRFRIRVF